MGAIDPLARGAHRDQRCDLVLRAQRNVERRLRLNSCLRTGNGGYIPAELEIHVIDEDLRRVHDAPRSEPVRVARINENRWESLVVLHSPEEDRVLLLIINSDGEL